MLSSFKALMNGRLPAGDEAAAPVSNLCAVDTKAAAPFTLFADDILAREYTQQNRKHPALLHMCRQR